MDRPGLVPRAVRVARPVSNVAATLHFYVDILGLDHLGGFEGHEGYDGAFVGPAGADWHLEFTRHVSGSPFPSPTVEDLLVLYVEDQDFAEVTAALADAGVRPVPHENPYWAGVGAVAYQDPDGYLVMLHPVSA